MNAFSVVRVIAAVALLVAMSRMPYGYYTLMKLIVFGTAIWGVYVSLGRQHSYLPWIYGSAALIFNPLISVRFTRVEWFYIDLAYAIIFFTSIFFNNGEHRNDA